MKRLSVTEWISMDQQSEYMGQTPVLTNTQMANRYLQNSLHNAIVDALAGVSEGRVDRVIYIPSQANQCYWSSTVIPQYFTSTYLTGISLSVGNFTYLEEEGTVKFMPQAENRDFRLGEWCRAHGPQRPEYLQLQFPSFEVPLMELTDPQDQLIPQYTTDDYQYSLSINHLFRFSQAPASLHFPPGYGIKLDYSDLVLSKYHWTPRDSESPQALRIQYELMVDLTELIEVLRSINPEISVEALRALDWSDTPIQSMEEMYATRIGLAGHLYPGDNRLSSLPLRLPTSATMIALSLDIGDHVDSILLRALPDQRGKKGKKGKKVHRWKISGHEGTSVHDGSFLFGSYGPPVNEIASHRHIYANHRPAHGVPLFLPPYHKLLKSTQALQVKLEGNNLHPSPIDTHAWVTVYWIPAPAQPIPFVPEEQIGLLDYCEH